MLADNTQIFTWLASEDQKQKLATEDSPDNGDTNNGGKTKETMLLPGQLPPVWMNCSVGAEILEGEVDSDESKVQVIFHYRPLNPLSEAL